MTQLFELNSREAAIFQVPNVSDAYGIHNSSVQATEEQTLTRSEHWLLQIKPKCIDYIWAERQDDNWSCSLPSTILRRPGSMRLVNNANLSTMVRIQDCGFLELAHTSMPCSRVRRDSSASISYPRMYLLTSITVMSFFPCHLRCSKTSWGAKSIVEVAGSGRNGG